MSLQKRSYWQSRHVEIGGVGPWGHFRFLPIYEGSPVRLREPSNLVQDLQLHSVSSAHNLTACEPITQLLAQLVGKGQSLLLVLHDVLHYVPFHIALIDVCPVVYLPSVIAVGDNDAPGQMPLYTAEHEATAAAEHFGEATLLLAEDATYEQVIAQAAHGGADVLHIACHGLFDPTDPLESGVVLRAGQVSRRWTAYDILQSRLSFDLVTLSACEVGTSSLRPGDELIGLMRALLFAEVRSVIASLWQVDDFAAQQLMETFYERLVSGEDKAQALWHAARTLRQRVGEQATSQWGCFVLMGE